LTQLPHPGAEICKIFVSVYDVAFDGLVSQAVVAAVVERYPETAKLPKALAISLHLDFHRYELPNIEGITKGPKLVVVYPRVLQVVKFVTD